MLCTSQDVISLDNNPCDTGCLTSNPFFFFLQLCTTTEKLTQFMQNTLLFVQSESQSVNITEQMETALDSLHNLGHIKMTGSTDSTKIEVTQLGHATFKGLEKIAKEIRSVERME